MSSSWLVSVKKTIKERDYKRSSGYRSTYRTLTTSATQHHANACSGLQTTVDTLAQYGWTRTSDCVSHVKTLVQNNPWLGVVPVALVAVSLTWEAIQSIRAWWNGEISGMCLFPNDVSHFSLYTTYYGLKHEIS